MGEARRASEQGISAGADPGNSTPRATGQDDAGPGGTAGARDTEGAVGPFFCVYCRNGCQAQWVLPPLVQLFPLARLFLSSKKSRWGLGIRPPALPKQQRSRRLEGVFRVLFKKIGSSR